MNHFRSFRPGVPLLALLCLAPFALRAASGILLAADAGPRQRLAARELRRHVYLRTGELMEIRADGTDGSNGSDGGIILKTEPGLAAEQYRLKTEKGPALIISGGSDPAVLHGAYAFAEKLGVRFYLHGDVVPDAWYNTFAASVTMCEWAVARAELGDAVNRRSAEKDPAAKTTLARVWDKLMAHIIGTVSTPGELGTIANLELRSRVHQKYLNRADPVIEQGRRRPPPPECAPTMEYAGPARISVPTVRGSASPGEAMTLMSIALDRAPVKKVTVHVRPLGAGDWTAIAASHVGRAVWSATLPAVRGDLEYRIEAETASAQTLLWPATAPALNQTVVIAE